MTRHGTIKRWLHYLFISAILCSTFQALLPSVVAAVDIPGWTACYDLSTKYAGSGYRYSSLNSAEQKIINACLDNGTRQTSNDGSSTIFSTHTNSAGIRVCKAIQKSSSDPVFITCENPALEVAKQSAKDAKVNPVINVVCPKSEYLDYYGGAGSKNSKTGMTYDECVNSTKRAYDACATVQLPTGIQDASSSDVANCIKDKVKTSAVISDIEAAINSGRTAGQSVLDQAKAADETKNLARQQALCEGKVPGPNETPATMKPKGTWNGKSCEEIAKQATATCQVNGIGWIVCPVVSFMAMIVDGAYEGVEALLIVPPITTNTNSPMYAAWSIVRNFANVCFVVAFMIIILSQVSSVGINNYGIKKLLPKLIIAAILVNVSYWICALAVDASNAVGAMIKPMVESVSVKLPANDGDFAFTDGLWMRIAGTIMAGSVVLGVAFAGTLSIFLPLLITAVLAIAVTFIVLTVRQAFIILLVVISPLAFVAYLLPNTESMFKKWFDAFKVLLLMFPIIAGVFALSRFAGTIVMTSAKDNFWVQMAGAGMTIIPLFITPIVMKAAGGMLNRIGAFVNNPNKGPVDFLRKGAGNIRQREKNSNRNRLLNTTGNKFNPIGRAQRAWTRRGARIEAIDTAQKSEANRAQTGYIAGLAEKDESFRSKMTAGSGDGAATRVQAQAVRANQKMNREAVDDVVALLENGPPEAKIDNTLAMLKNANASKDIVTARAAAQVLRNSGTKGKDALHNVVKELSDSENFHPDVEEGIRADGVAAGTKAYDSVLDSWNVKGGKLSDHITSQNMARLNETELAGQSGSRIREAMAAGAISKEQAASVIKANEQGTVPLDGEKKALLQKIANGESTSTGASEAAATSGSTSGSMPQPTTPVSQGRDRGQPQSVVPDPISPPGGSTSTSDSSGGTTPNDVTHLGRTYEPNESGFLVPRK